MKLSHAVWGHRRWSGHGGDIWQNVVHWRREGPTTSVFLPWEPHEEYEKAKDRTLQDELPTLIGAQYAPGDQWRNTSRKNEQKESKQKKCWGSWDVHRLCLLCQTHFLKYINSTSKQSFLLLLNLKSSIEENRKRVERKKEASSLELYFAFIWEVMQFGFKIHLLCYVGY